MNYDAVLNFLKSRRSVRQYLFHLLRSESSHGPYSRSLSIQLSVIAGGAVHYPLADIGNMIGKAFQKTADKQ